MADINEEGMIYLQKEIETKNNQKKIFPNHIRAVIFDLDGVLVDSVGTWFSVFNDAMKQINAQPINMGEFKEKVWGVPADSVLDEYFKGKLPVQKILEIYNKGFENNIELTKLCENAVILIEALHKNNYKLAIASNSHSKIVELLLSTFGIRKYFLAVYSGDKVSKGKPDPEMLLKAANDIHTPIKNCIFVGDTITDVKAGIAAKIFTIGRGIDADARIENLLELLDLLNLEKKK